MKFAIVCDEMLKQEWLERKISGDVDTCFVSLFQEIPPDTEVIIDLLFENSPARVSQLQQFLPRPVFINAVVDTLRDIGQPFIRLNGWPGFIKREMIEVAASSVQAPVIKIVFEKMQWTYLPAPDKAGMVSARIIAGIINEAYHALGEGVSTRDEIDIAMKTGTNYPLGPFEWGRLIGVRRIYDLLVKLCAENEAMTIAPLLASEVLSEV